MRSPLQVYREWKAEREIERAVLNRMAKNCKKTLLAVYNRNRISRFEAERLCEVMVKRGYFLITLRSGMGDTFRLFDLLGAAGRGNEDDYRTD